MDIQTGRIELEKVILSTNDKVLINQLKDLFKNNNVNWWDELPSSVQQEIDQSIAQADRGEFISLAEVKKDIRITMLEKA
jgi:type I site-specific restriction-modification system R (restriction) subunit